ncbi:MAG: hypothetical protein JWP50_1834 [Phenylobacterium sp.]|nr:hypothetical protein [Phenylobacterium sp.]
MLQCSSQANYGALHNDESVTGRGATIRLVQELFTLPQP